MMMEDVWTDKHQTKSQKEEGGHDASRDTTVEASPYSCDVCGVNVNTYHDLEMHLRGRAHLEMLERSEVAHRSVFVRGFPVTASIESELRELLSQFGSLAMLIVKVNKQESSGSYALAEFHSEEDALKALRCSLPLILHGKKVVVRPRQVKPVKRKVRCGRKQWLDLGQRCVGAASSEMDTPPSEKEVATTPDSIGGIRLTKEAIAAITAAQSVDAQLEAIASYCRLGDAAVNEQLILCSRLQSRFQSAYPKCMVIPFGASVSGHGTLSSDCDLCVLTDPLPVERTMFSGPVYFSQQLHSMWRQLEDTCSKTNFQPKASTVATHYHSTFAQTDPSYDNLLALVEGDEECDQVLAIANARCPVIRFVYRPFNVHCDLSINNRLGPANTRLMAAYFQFDPRMAVLVPIIRLWTRAQGVQQSQLNNYALSLMVIHFLQTVSPPVLPCLQDPGVWPKDMAWIGSKGFSNPQEPLVVDGWKCNFDPPQSLLPSTNTATPAELFLQFLHYYADCFPFSECVVAIHCCSPPHISQLSQRVSSQKMSSGEVNTSPPSCAGFRVSSLCVQDPFELSHNVAKGMNRSQMSHIHHRLQSAHATLKELLSAEMGSGSSRQDVISVFSQSRTREQSKKPLTVRTLTFSLDIISRLLLKTTPYVELAQRLQELDMHNLHTRHLLNCIILKALAMTLEEEFDFSVCLKTYTCDVPPSNPLKCSPQSSRAHRYILTQKMERVDHGQQRKRQRLPEEAEEEGIKKVEHEPQCSEKEEDETRTVYEGVKRFKVARDEKTAENLLYHLTKGSERGVFLCKAIRETWTHCRRQRREKRQNPMASGSPSHAFDQTMSDLGDSLPSVSPCLIFTLALGKQEVEISKGVCTTVELQATHIKYSQPLQNFYAFFKKWLLHIT